MPNKRTLILIIVPILLVAVLYSYLYLIRRKVKTSSSNNNVQAFLMMLRKCEGTSGPNGYRTLFGGKLFTDFSKHPNVKVPFRNTYSTAAGAYQFLYSTWRSLQLRLGLEDFSPANQNLAAIELIRERNALVDIEQGRITTAINKVRKIWASLPGAGYGQPEKPLAVALSYYSAAGGKLSNSDTMA